MKFEFITQENWEAAICLRPKESQYRFIRRDVVLDSLARCYVQPDTPDKFLLYLIIYQEDSIDSFLFRSYGIGCNLTSFFIDRNYQGRGLGKLAMETYIDWAKRKSSRFCEIELCVGPGNIQAKNLYESLGFVYTGEVSELGNLHMELHF